MEIRSSIAECGASPRQYQQGDGVIKPHVSSNDAARGAMDGLSQVCWFSLIQTVVHQHPQPEIDPGIFQATRPTQPGHPSMDRCSEHRQWILSPLGSGEETASCT